MFQPMASTTRGRAFGWSTRSRKASWWARALRTAKGSSGPSPVDSLTRAATSSTAARRRSTSGSARNPSRMTNPLSSKSRSCAGVIAMAMADLRGGAESAVAVAPGQPNGVAGSRSPQLTRAGPPPHTKGAAKRMRRSKCGATPVRWTVKCLRQVRPNGAVVEWEYPGPGARVEHGGTGLAPWPGARDRVGRRAPAGAGRAGKVRFLTNRSRIRQPAAGHGRVRSSSAIRS